MILRQLSTCGLVVRLRTTFIFFFKAVHREHHFGPLYKINAFHKEENLCTLH